MEFLQEEYTNIKILKDRITITKDEAKKEIMTNNFHKRRVLLLEQLQNEMYNKDINYNKYKDLFDKTFALI